MNLPAKKFAVMIALAAGASAMAGGALLWPGDPSRSAVLGADSAQEGAARISAPAPRARFGDVVASSMPSIAQVRILSRVAPAELDEGDDKLLEFLRRFAPDAPRLGDPNIAPPGSEDVVKPPPPASPGAAPRPPFPKPPAKRPLASGVGTAFLIDAQGHLLTNAHVVARAEKITLSFFDGREVSAKVVGVDERTDLALLKIEGAGHKPLPMGNPHLARVGDPVLAIGSPFGFAFSASSGILSGKNRTFSHDDNYLPMLQTDAAINPGNSGGPLLNEQGQVIGLSNQIFSQSGGSMGIGFAIPIDHALAIAAKLKAHGRVEHGRIGVVVAELTPELALAFGVGSKRGAIVMSVEDKGPGAQAGLLQGDIVTAANGKALASSQDMVLLIAGHEPGFVVDLAITRAGRPMSLTVATGKSPRTDAKEPDAPRAKPSAPFGLALRPLTPQEAKASGVPRGLKVVEPSGADSSGLDAGDIVLAVNHDPVGSLAELAAAASSIPKGIPGALLIKRKGSTFYLALMP